MLDLVQERGIGVIPGSSFLPHEIHYRGTTFETSYKELVDPFRDVLDKIRIGFGGAATDKSIITVLEEIRSTN